ncbi:TPA: hypothetical protein O4T76_002608 [Staphylococcus aureus]|uniref:hypothetical protein n=1 Tax=Staphylococcus TaxID=1279 RepID=UPI00044685E0|nr:MULTISPECIES: hypothetical protein [Staphylococcus]EZS17912.1 hypothetical protein W630_02693 [Staphylococcus aureus VET0400R]EZT06482.1 hypothetical protein W438_02622 [Staphylococcus aureus VET0111R]EZX92947.1 hypothetical protein V086_02653 [Staphylococcus aureus GD2010-090]KAA72450.1 hypothetical protein W428_02615 [Staphylococcus aureus VET0097R]MCE5159879.1 hypothetical protein [Staphylococcus epidermidis]
MVKIVPGYELDYFDWLVRQRLIKFPAMPIEGEWKQDSYGYDDIIFENEIEYQDLVIDTEKSYPEFDFYKMALESISLISLDDFHKKTKH